ncbi:MAG: hypothetical protein HGJ93_00750 [Desulfosarcina sp.]|nr:hypothetical protein [Desulfosarcina sp.]MBC2764515.1 hypothetical protein [Desulfosarcina sp.]
MAFDWKQLVRTVAPGIASVFGTPLAGMATKVIADAVLGPGKDQDKDIDDQLNAAMIGASPDVLIRIKEADQQFTVEMRKLDIDLEKMAYADVASARNREIQIKDKMPAVIATILIIMFGLALGALFKYDIPEANKTVVMSMVGSLGTMAVTAAAYYLGSSRGSARKDGTISQAIGK